MSFDDIKTHVCTNRDTLQVPENCPPLIRDLLQMHCWRYDAEERPTFDSLLTVFEKLKSDNSLLENISIMETFEGFAPLTKPNLPSIQTRNYWLCFAIGIISSMVILVVGFVGLFTYSNHEQPLIDWIAKQDFEAKGLLWFNGTTEHECRKLRFQCFWTNLGKWSNQVTFPLFIGTYLD